MEPQPQHSLGEYKRGGLTSDGMMLRIALLALVVAIMVVAPRTRRNSDRGARRAHRPVHFHQRANLQ